MQRREHQHARVAPQVTIWQRQLSQVARVALQATIQRPLGRLQSAPQRAQRGPTQQREHLLVRAVSLDLIKPLQDQRHVLHVQAGLTVQQLVFRA